MPFFTYVNDTPNPPNDPSVDAPDMRTNTNSNSSIWDVDHVGFNVALGGTHKFVTYSGKNTPAAQSGQSSAAYTVTGTANPAAPQHVWQNASGVFPLSAIKAFCSFARVGGGSPSVPFNQFNILSIQNTGGNANGPYVITLQPTTIATNDVVIFIFLQNSSTAVDYTVNSVAQTITIPTLPATSFINLLILQM
jgi:hypothetical protein